LCPVLRRQSDTRTADPSRQWDIRVRAYELFVLIGCDNTRVDECWHRAIEEVGGRGRTASDDPARGAPDARQTDNSSGPGGSHQT